MNRKIPVAILFVGLISGCQRTLDVEPGEVTLGVGQAQHVRVRANGENVTVATVEPEAPAFAESTTDLNTFIVLGRAAGTSRVRFDASGYEPFYLSVTVKP